MSAASWSHHRWHPHPTGRGFFERGALKFLVLDLVRTRPRHGYDIIREIEERSFGFYSPSPGSIYPTLQLLEDQGLVQSADEEGRRIYRITDAGESFLAQHQERLQRHRDRFHRGCMGRAREEGAEYLREIRRLLKELREATWRQLERPETAEEIRDILRQAKNRISDVGRAGPQQSGGSQEAGN